MRLEHFEYLRVALKGALRPDATMRQRWDALYANKLLPWICDNLYPYLNDDHIDTALRQIAREGTLAYSAGTLHATLLHERQTTGVDRRHWTETTVIGGDDPV